MSATKLTAVGMCHECDTVYSLVPGHRIGDGLPCGHKNISFHAPSSLLSALRDALFVNWAHDNGYLEDAIEGIREAGGDFDPCGCGPARLTLPERS
jgi:hypothetical protein